MSSYRDLLERAGDRVPMPEPALERLSDRRRAHRRNQRTFAGAAGVGLAIALVIALISVGNALKDADVIKPLDPSPSLAGPLDLLPAANALATSGGSSPLHFWVRGGDARGTSMFLYLYEDGRLLTNPGPYDEFVDTRWVERRLTAGGVRLMLDAVRDSVPDQDEVAVEGFDGWFQYSRTAGYNDVVEWGSRGWVRDSAPVADDPTADALRAVSDLLRTPERFLPASAWDRSEAVPYVPEAYLLTMDASQNPTPDAWLVGRTNIHELQLAPGTSLPSIGGCSTLDLQAARDLAAAFDSADDRFNSETPMPGVGMTWAFLGEDGKLVFVTITRPLPHENCDQLPDR